MRMNEEDDFSAYDVINDYSEDELYRIISSYGEEKWASGGIAKFIINERKKKPINTTGELVEIIKAAIPAGGKEKRGLIRQNEHFRPLELRLTGNWRLLKHL